jgi:hypothetical protein
LGDKILARYANVIKETERLINSAIDSDRKFLNIADL